MECADSTEIAIHDSGASFHSFMYYSTNGNFYMGRNMGHGTATINMSQNTGQLYDGCSMSMDGYGWFNSTDPNFGGQGAFDGSFISSTERN
jgi:hypothetical protein